MANQRVSSRQFSKSITVMALLEPTRSKPFYTQCLRTNFLFGPAEWMKFEEVIYDQVGIRDVRTYGDQQLTDTHEVIHLMIDSAYDLGEVREIVAVTMAAIKPLLNSATVDDSTVLNPPFSHRPR